jgi:hypothetical protein
MKSIEFEEIGRKIFQCGRDEDPLGIVSNADNWDGIFTNEDQKEYAFKAWVLLKRLKKKYLYYGDGRKYLEKANELEEKIRSARSNKTIVKILIDVKTIVEALELSEFPNINYEPTNFNNQE